MKKIKYVCISNLNLLIIKVIMKKIIVLAVLFCTITETNAQDFNKWSIDLGVGVHIPVFPITPGYGIHVPDFWQANAGIRYMINEKFGFRVDFGYNKFTGGNISRSFDTDYYRGTIEAVVNAGELLGFKDWTQRINVLVHGGGGLSETKMHNPINDTADDSTVNFILGVTPQVKITDRVALFVDVSAIMHLYQHVPFDGYGRTSINGFNGQIFNATLGLNIYLGKNKEHADWHTKFDDTEEKENHKLES